MPKISPNNPVSSQTTIGVLGLGYVGLPLAVAFGERFTTLGFDIVEKRVRDLRSGIDSTLEVTSQDLDKAKKLSFTADPNDLAEIDIYVIAVPTPIDRQNQPDLSPLENASRLVGKSLRPGNTVIYESTVYPGATEEVCIPIIESTSELRLNKDFFAGYSPERINPGDSAHQLKDIVKVTSGSGPEALEIVDSLYREVIPAGTHPVSNIRTAEASKVIENTQRDINIALINELALIFEKLDLDTEEVLKAAGTKWNFLPFKPGLVGGHCISVDPYYLTHKAQAVGYQPDIILEARRINDGMATHIGNRVVKLMAENKINIVGSRVLIMGFAFKENCPDTRNTQVEALIKVFETYNACVEIFDPLVMKQEVLDDYGIELIAEPRRHAYDAVVIAVAHSVFLRMGTDAIQSFRKEKSVLFDIKHLLSADESTARL